MRKIYPEISEAQSPLLDEFLVNKIEELFTKLNQLEFEGVKPEIVAALAFLYAHSNIATVIEKAQQA